MNGPAPRWRSRGRKLPIMILLTPRSRDSRRARAAGGVLALTLCVVSCSSAPGPGGSAPDWVDAPPTDAAYLYGTGSFVGSFYTRDNEKNAIETAKKNLANRIRSDVVTASRIRYTTSGQSGTAESRATSEVQLQNVELIQTWRDLDGLRSKPGTVWVLVRVPKGGS